MHREKQASSRGSAPTACSAAAASHAWTGSTTGMPQGENLDRAVIETRAIVEVITDSAEVDAAYTGEFFVHCPRAKAWLKRD